jgi:hypothetical protein
MFSLKKPLLNLALVLLFSNQAYSNVLVSLDDVEAPGYTDEIIVPVTIENSENSVGGIQFDIMSSQEALVLSGVVALESENFSVDFNVLNDGSARVVFFSNNGTGIEPGGNSVVLNLIFDGSQILSGFYELDAFDLTVSDNDGVVVSSQVNDGTVTVGSVVSFSSSSDTGDV